MNSWPRSPNLKESPAVPQNYKRPLIFQPETEIRELLKEVRQHDDEDLWETVVARINDALIDYRRWLKQRDEAWAAAFVQAFTEDVN